MLIDLAQAFPEGTDGMRAPLPKQGEFMRYALAANTNPKYIAYMGGIGSGKTLIGCITILSQAIMYPGEYMICRQFMPELKATTYKTFMEICPPELIVEHRVADSLVKVRAANNQISTIYFRPLEEPEKFRSFNLSGFYIDEATQVSEESFILLQGRLRGKGIRKGILTGNPAGHDWVYRWFFKKDHLKSDVAKNQFHLITAPSTENVHLPEGYVESMMNAWSDDRIQREIYASFDAFEGQVYHEFRRDVHVVRPFRIPDEWPKHIRIDHGYRNPAAMLCTAISPEGEVYVYRELYEREWLIGELIKGDKKTNKVGLLQRIPANEKFQTVKIDPSTKARRGTTGESDYDEYRRNWPEQMPMIQMAKNDVELGIDRVKSYLKVHPKTKRPMLYIFDSCTNLLEEITTYRYPQLKAAEDGKKPEAEKPIKVNDHALDALRYMIVDLPEPYEVLKPEDINKYTQAERSLQKELKEINNPPVKDPFHNMF